MPPQLKIGDTCILHGLKAQPSFNGHKVTLVEWMPKEGRFVLRPVEQTGVLPPVLAIKPDNLKPYNESAPSTGNAQKYSSGTRLVLEGLKAQPHFNGHEVIVTGFLFDQGRYKVKPGKKDSPLPHTLAIKPENLNPIATRNSSRNLQRAHSHRDMGMSKSSSSRGLGQSQHKASKPVPVRRMSRHQSLSQLDDTKNDGHKIGGKYQLEGLRSVPHFNGHIVIIKSYLKDEGRYQVGPANPKGPLPAEFAVKPANLVTPSLNKSAHAPQEVSNNQSLVKSNSQRSLMGGFVRSYSQKSLVLPEDSQPGAQQGTATIEPGTTMIITGLKSQPAWNGEKVVVHDYILEEDRYQVSPSNPTVEMPKVLALKPINLQPVQDDDEERDSVPMNIQVPSSSEEDNGATDDVSTSASAPYDQKTLSVGTNVVLKRSDKVDLEGEEFRIVQVFSEKREYKLEAVSPGAMDACMGGDVVASHYDLAVVEPSEKKGKKKILEVGDRGVIQEFSGSLNGHLVKVLSYNERRKSYLVQPLGKLATNSAGSEAVNIPEQNIAKAPNSAFWTSVSKKGRKMFVPCAAKVTRSNDGQKMVTANISTFPGFDKVAGLGRILLGEDKCDWSNPVEVTAVFSKNASNPVSVEVKDDQVRKTIEEDEIVARYHKHAATIDALVEYELLENTNRTVEVEGYGSLPVYKIIFSFDDEPCDASDASPRTVMSTQQATVRHSNRALLKRAGSSRALFGAGDDNEEPEDSTSRRSDGLSRRKDSSRKLSRKDSARGLTRKTSASKMKSDSLDISDLVELIAAKELEKEKLEEELNELKASLVARKAKAQSQA